MQKKSENTKNSLTVFYTCCVFRVSFRSRIYVTTKDPFYCFKWKINLTTALLQFISRLSNGMLLAFASTQYWSHINWYYDALAMYYFSTTEQYKFSSLLYPFWKAERILARVHNIQRQHAMLIRNLQHI